MSYAERGPASATLTEAMIPFRVVTEPYARAVGRDRRMMTLCWCRGLAVEQASRSENCGRGA
jgi:hypothetical protein